MLSILRTLLIFFVMTLGLAQAEPQPGKAFRDCAKCPEMVVIPAGSFQMGSDGHASEKPIHGVTIAAPFALASTEVTQGQWRAVMGSNPSYFSGCGDACPVERISWDDAQEFVRKLSAKTGKRYRLPSEAEWEYACRAGGQQEYCGGDDLDQLAWYGAYATPVGTSGKATNPVHGKQPNAWGLHDMSGSVAEWLQDCWNPNYDNAPSDGSAWITGQCAVGRVMRGGSWDAIGRISRAAARNGADTAFRNYNLGLRPARALP